MIYSVPVFDFNIVYLNEYAALSVPFILAIPLSLRYAFLMYNPRYQFKPSALAHYYRDAQKLAQQYFPTEKDFIKEADHIALAMEANENDDAPSDECKRIIYQIGFRLANQNRHLH